MVSQYNAWDSSNVESLAIEYSAGQYYVWNGIHRMVSQYHPRDNHTWSSNSEYEISHMANPKVANTAIPRNGAGWGAYKALFLPNSKMFYFQLMISL